MLRLLGFVYFIAFLVAANQLVPLIGRRRPAAGGCAICAGSRNISVRAPRDFSNCRAVLARASPTRRCVAVAWIGVVLSLVVLLGYANALIMLALWALYTVDRQRRAALVRLRLGDPAARDRLPRHLPLPAARRPSVSAPRAAARGDLAVSLAHLSHHARRGADQAARRPVLARPDLPRLPLRDAADPESAELVAPLSARTGFTSSARSGTTSSSSSCRGSRSGRAPSRHVAGVAARGFQVVLIVSGNLSFLNWLTIVPCLACFDDTLLGAAAAARVSCSARAQPRSRRQPSPARSEFAGVALAAGRRAAQHRAGAEPALAAAGDERLVRSRCTWSTPTARSAASGRERNEIVFEGTDESDRRSPRAVARIRVQGKPGDPHAPPVRSSRPISCRLDWQIWFAAMATPQRLPVDAPLCLEAPAQRSRHAQPAREQSVSRRAAALRPRRALSLPLHAARRSRRPWWKRERSACGCRRSRPTSRSSAAFSTREAGFVPRRRTRTG